jgi:peptidoglycan/xylan/chitin deacetylase (PgdA/CDA1 family)
LPKPVVGRPLAIITYHSISPNPSRISISPDKFRAQITALRRARIRAMSLGQALDHQQRPASMVKVVALTFDDGYADFATEAWPVLRKAGYGATVFPVTGRLSSDNDWPGQPIWAPRMQMLARGQVRQLAKEGVEFGSHSVSHPHLTMLSPDVLETELVLSRRAIESATEQACRYFSYPYGDVSAAVRYQVSEQFTAAVTTEIRVADQTSDPFLLPRIDAAYFSPAALVGAVYSLTGLAYIAVRRLGHRARNLILGDH